MNRVQASIRSACVCAAVASSARAQGPCVFVEDDRLRTDASLELVGESVASAPLALTSANVCNETLLAWEPQPVPGGGTLAPNFYSYDSPALAGAGRIAFFSLVNGSPRNQGIFVTDGTSLQPIVMGSGAGAGSGPGTGVGDPSPIGGRFAGIFGGWRFVPGSNAAGDVLFLADVDGGSAPRGMFLYQAASSSIVKVAAVGDVSPTGATLTQIGPGVLNDAGVVVFIASRGAPLDNEILRWQNGVLTKIAADGDPAPSGGNYVELCRDVFTPPDGTQIPYDAGADINELGVICFVARTSLNVQGLIVRSPAGVSQWYARAGDATGQGGTFTGLLMHANINNAGQVAFFASCQGQQHGTFVGTPGNWRKVVAFYDLIDVGPCVGIGQPYGPTQQLADNGDFAQWVAEDTGAGFRYWMLVSRANGVLESIVKSATPSPLGGSIGVISQAAFRGNQLALGYDIAGVPGIESAYFLDAICGAQPSTYCTAGTTVNGCVAAISGTGTPSASATSGFTIAATRIDGQRAGIVFYSASGALIQPWGVGSTSFLCVKTPTQRTGLQNSGGTLGQCNGAIALDFNAFRAANPNALGQPMSVGQTLDAQIWFRDPGAVKNTSLSNALEFSLAP